MRTFALAFLLMPALALAQPVPDQTPAAQAVQKAKSVIRAQYAWGYSGMDGEGSGTLSVLLEPSSGKVVMELHGLSERLMLLSGNQGSGYHVQIPRQELDRTVPSFGALPLPFLPQLGSAEALRSLLTEGTGPGVKVSKRDQRGPLKHRYEGHDEHGKDVTVWLNRTRWETE
jgi:hypothetical protein